MSEEMTFLQLGRERLAQGQLDYDNYNTVEKSLEVLDHIRMTSEQPITISTMVAILDDAKKILPQLIALKNL